MILFVMGIMLAMGVVTETGAMSDIAAFIDREVNNVWIVGIATGAISSFLDNFATAMSMISMRGMEIMPSAADAQGASLYVQNGIYWKIVAYASSVGGNILCTGSMSGMALMKMERLRFGWYFRNAGWKAMAGAVVGFMVLWGTYSL